jgi:hypothetical protein
MRVVPLTAFTVLLPSLLGADEANPKRNDSRWPQPAPAKLIPSATPGELKAGHAFTYQIKVSLDPGWKIFSCSPVQPQGSAPFYTKLDLFDTGGLKASRDWQASRAATKQESQVFPDAGPIEFHEGEVTWSLRIIVPRGTKPGNKTLKC